MKTFNADIDEFVQYISGKDLYIYGVGKVFHRLVGQDVYRDIHKNVKGYIDNGKAGTKIQVLGQDCKVQAVSILKTVEKGIVLLCGTKYMDEMYQILCGQMLSDDVECFILPLIWAVSSGQDDEYIKSLLINEDKSIKKIEKKIHCFWFSDDKKPTKYQYCIDSWKRVCPDYEIMEWNSRNYDCEKNTFIKQAFASKKWAFVSDYTRLDVIYQYGGIYLDMDVELLKSFDPLLGFEAFFNFGTQNDIDLGSGFGSVKNNHVIGKLLEIYKDKEFWDKNGNPMMEQYMQPALIREEFVANGFDMNGNMQLRNDMIVLPRKYYAPMDDFFLQNFVQCDDTRGIHHYNAGWWTKEWQNERDSHMWWVDIAQNTIRDKRKDITFGGNSNGICR